MRFAWKDISHPPRPHHRLLGALQDIVLNRHRIVLQDGSWQRFDEWMNPSLHAVVLCCTIDCLAHLARASATRVLRKGTFPVHFRAIELLVYKERLPLLLLFSVILSQADSILGALEITNLSAHSKSLMYIYIYVCIYIHLHTYLYLYIFTYIHMLYIWICRYIYK